MLDDYQLQGPPLLAKALTDGSDLEPAMFAAFIYDLGGVEETILVTDFAFFTARGVSLVIRSMRSENGPVNLLSQGKLFAQCRWIAINLGGEAAHTFSLTGLQDEPLQPATTHPPRPERRSRSRRRRARSRTPKRSSKTTRKFGGVLQRGG